MRVKEIGRGGVQLFLKFSSYLSMNTPTVALAEIELLKQLFLVPTLYGATTTCEALWMGVPVVTLAGNTHASRMWSSILAAVGLPELIAQTPAEYINICIKLASDTHYLAVPTN
jgi:predicted O-linked N-acetylglucosamine transferase (SPINDLY family)